MANLKRLPELLAYLKRLKASGREDKWDMSVWLRSLEEGHDSRGYTVVDEGESLRFLFDSPNPECGTAGCLAGSMVIMDQQMHADPASYFQEQLELSTEELHYMTHGRWSWYRMEASLDEAIMYLETVIQTGVIESYIGRE